MSFGRFVASLQAPALIEIANRWNSARRARTMPAWRDIDPAAIRRHLSIVWAWRYDATQGTYIGRLAGETIVEVLGIQIRGRRLEDCFAPSSVSVLRQRFDRAMSGPSFMRSTGSIYVTSGRHGDGERITMPLSEDGQHCDGFFGATAYTSGSLRSRGSATANPELEEEVEFFDV